MKFEQSLRILGYTKNKIENLHKSGIYEFKCDDCEKTYIGQTKRNIKQRYKEHFSHIKYNRPEKSAFAQHILEEGHNTNVNNVTLLKDVKNSRHLDAYESYFISKNNTNLLNHENGNINSELFNFNFA